MSVKIHDAESQDEWSDESIAISSCPVTQKKFHVAVITPYSLATLTVGFMRSTHVMALGHSKFTVTLKQTVEDGLYFKGEGMDYKFFIALCLSINTRIWRSEW